MNGLSQLWQRMTKRKSRNQFGGRTLAIGDVHGCAKALQELLEFTKVQANDIVVMVGDYIDRGPDSRGVVDQILELRERCHLVTLLGNHEHMLLELVRGNLLADFWLNCGGQETLDSYGGSLDGIPAEHLEFFQQCERWYETEENIFVHANYDPQLAIEDQPDQLRLWEHISINVPPPHVSGKTVVVGHTPQLSGLVLNAGHLLCIDTFCFGRGCLTALNVLTGDIWQVNRFGVRCQP